MNPENWKKLQDTSLKAVNLLYKLQQVEVYDNFRIV